jgi:hypothetical protein
MNILDVGSLLVALWCVVEEAHLLLPGSAEVEKLMFKGSIYY